MGTVDFPQVLVAYGLSEELLAQLFEEVLSKKMPLSWCLNVMPNVDFYQTLHPYLKQWHVTCKASKTAIGKFYLAIDKFLLEKTDRADNAYRFIDNLSKSKYTSGKQVDYGCRAEIERQFKECQKKLEEMKIEVAELKGKLEVSHHKMQSAHDALRTVTNDKLSLQSEKLIAERKAVKYREDNNMLQEDCEKLIEENLDLSATILDIRDELSKHNDEPPYDDCQATSNGCELMASLPPHNNSCSSSNFTIQTKQGRKYSPSIRKLYYTLLADEVPASSISNIVKSVVKCFNPSVDVESLVLPQRSCANYMCRDELRTISNAHKATVLSECSTKGFPINTDGTTKGQRKLEGLAINNMAISVNELSDGSADQAIADISKELATLRNVAHVLNLPNADTINWTMIASSTSDSASTQKRLNTLIHKCKEADEKKYGKATTQTVDLIESFCSMHLGINLRKAFLNGIAQDSLPGTSYDRERHPVDVFVHEFCKLFGKFGCPEYGCGAINFPDFLAIMLRSDSKQSSTYYNLCASVTLERQVGSRYFVTAANAAKIVFLKDAAIEFLEYSGKSTGNKLERDVYTKLHNQTEIAQLRVDALMFYHVYADLVMLCKSNELKKSVLDMNVHYLELKTFLQEIEQDPAIALDKDHAVFTSELATLYGKNKKVNHRLHTKVMPVHKKVFDVKDDDLSILYPMLAAGATKMKEKLCMYAQQQLPGGKYWSPDNPIIKEHLSKLTPSNDLCESILGLNDYLTSKIPNLNQRSISNLVEVKKNHSIMWLNSLDDTKQTKLINLATDLRQSVGKDYIRHTQQVAQERQQRMAKAHAKQQAMKIKMQKQKDHLEKQHLVTSAKELQDLMNKIEESEICASKKKVQKLSLLKCQINIRKKVLGQKINIVFTHSGRQRSIHDLEKELADAIEQDCSNNSEYAKQPSTLIGRQISHRFKVGDSEYKWYRGTVLEYNSMIKMHLVEYDDDEEPSLFDLNIDLLNGDLEVLH